jgi:hypothetical protein
VYDFKGVEFLFGFSKRALMGHKLPYEPLARGRGVPSNASQEIQDDMRRVREIEEQFGPSGFCGCTHIDYSEIEAVDWPSVGIDPEQSEWSVLFKLIGLLRSDPRFRDAGVRIVCWASW